MFADNRRVKPRGETRATLKGQGGGDLGGESGEVWGSTGSVLEGAGGGSRN